MSKNEFGDEMVGAECICGWEGWAGQTHICAEYLVRRIRELEDDLSSLKDYVRAQTDSEDALY